MLVFASIAALILAAPQDVTPAAAVDAIFKAYDTRTSPGCAVAVFQDDNVLYKRAYGMANLDHDVPLTSSTVFHVASVSKQFTASAILLLAQDGKLSLDDDIRKHIPELPDFGRTITIRQLANHTSGIRDQWDLLGLAGWRYSRDLITDDDVLELLTRQKALNFTPGSRHLYSNSGYTLLAVIVSRVSGKSFRAFTTERIFEPLGMTHTHFRDTFNEIVKNQAYGYSPFGQTFRLSVTNFDTAGATSLLTTVEDMAKWYANFDSGKVGGAKFVPALLEKGVLNDGETIPYALGITHGTYRGLPLVGHGGSDAGYRADFVRFTNPRLGVATLCNISTANPAILSRKTAEVFLPAGSLAAETEAKPDAAAEVPLPKDQLARYAGLYWSESDVAERRIALDGDRLQAILGGSQRVPLKSLGAGTFVMTAAPFTRLTFVETAGTAVQLKMPGVQTPLTRMEPFTPAAEQLAEYGGVYRSDEMDAVFRFSVKDGRLQLARSKLRPAALDPMFRDTFRAPAGIFQFSRDAAGRIDGFVLQGGRVRHVKFSKDIMAR